MQKISSVQKIILSSVAVLAMVFLVGVFARKSQNTFGAFGAVERVEVGRNDSLVNPKIAVIQAGKSGELGRADGIVKAKSVFYDSREEDGDLVFKNQVGTDKPFELNRNLQDFDLLKIVYDKVNKKLSFAVPPVKVAVNDKPLTTRQTNFYQLAEVEPNVLVRLGVDLIINLETYKNDKFIDLGTLKNQGIKLYVPGEKNLLEADNPSFETGLWAEQATDCSKGAGEAKISTFWALEGKDSARSMNLASQNHTACVEKGFKVGFDANKLYVLAFDYKSLEGNKGGVSYRLTGKAETKKDEKWVAPNREWNRFETIISTGLADKDGMTVQFQSPSNGKENIVNLFDNVSLKDYALVKTDVAAKNKPSALVLLGGINLNEGDNTLKILDLQDNLLAKENPSFETGFWTAEVADCSPKATGEAKLDMERVDGATDGEKAFKIHSANHNACVSKTFTVKGEKNKTYILSFNHRSLAGEKMSFGYSILDGAGATLKTKNENPKFENGDWQYYHAYVGPEVNGFASVKITLYANSDGKKEVANAFDNFRLVEYSPEGREHFFFNLRQTVPGGARFKTVEYRSEGIWQTNLVVHGAKDKIILTDGDGFGDRWNVFAIENPGGKKKPTFGRKYYVPEEKKKEQASAEEVKSFLDKKMISWDGPNFVSKNVQGSIRNENMPEWSFWKTLWGGRKISVAEHFKINGNENGWLIDVNAFCGEQKMCVDNGDGTFELTLLARHKYFWLVEAAIFALMAVVIYLAGRLLLIETGFQGLKREEIKERLKSVKHWIKNDLKLMVKDSLEKIKSKIGK